MSAFVDKHGHVLNERKSKESNEVMWAIIDDAFQYSRDKSTLIPQDQSLFDYFQTKLKEKDLEPTILETVLQMARIWGDFIGDPIQKQSLKYLWLEECIDGGPF